MERKRNFDIQFVGLKNAIHHLSYEVDDAFFKLYEVSPISKGQLHVKLKFDKKDSFFILNFEIDGIVNLPCDRCNDYFDYELLCDFDAIVKFDEIEKTLEEDEVIYISRGDSYFNVADLIYDYILINIPMQVFHPNDENGNSTCNPEMLSKLNPNQIQDNDIDPRWANLTKLKN